MSKPKGESKEPFVMLPRELIRSDAWRSQSINTRRFVEFLMVEHMRHGGKENGKLRAPYDQLQAIGICARYVSDAIQDAEERGLVECMRQGLKVVTLYRLTWLPAHDGSPATNEWREYRNPALRPWPVKKGDEDDPAAKNRNQPSQGKVKQPSQGKADGVNQPSQGKAPDPPKQPSQGKDPSRRSYQGRRSTSDLRVETAAAPAAPARACHVAADGAVWRAGPRGVWPFGVTPSHPDPSLASQQLEEERA